MNGEKIVLSLPVSTHSRLKAAGTKLIWHCCRSMVSTHSRLKAAGRRAYTLLSSGSRFNTQPPEGGWEAKRDELSKRMFQHTAA